MAKILILNGPNLNLLGTREPGVYGSGTLADLQHDLEKLVKGRQHQLSFHQSNAEHELIGLIQEAPQQQIAYIIINPAAFAHTSIALRDALLAVAIPFIEVHISNIYRREAFRHHSYLADIAKGVICGLGTFGYQLALNAIINEIESS